MLLEDRPAAVRVPHAPSRAARARAFPRPGLHASIVLGALALAALSLLLPSTPTYDPWAWIIWGREIAHLDLSTVEGPSWKPLPVFFTTIFSVFGDASPDLWLVIARAGAFAALAYAFLVARRLGGGVAGGVAAAAGLAIAPWWIRNGGMGNSEGLIIAFVLAAVERHLAGDRRAAFLLGACAALLRPEAWPFLGLYGLWLLWRRHLHPALVLGTGAAVLALWILPEWWGSGDAWRAAHRAKDVNPGAPTYAENPALAVLEDAGEMLTTAMLLGLAAIAVRAALVRDRAVVWLMALAVAWLGLVVYMTSDGFSGNQRYLMTPVALGIVLGAAGAGWVVTAVARRAGPAGIAVAAVALGAAFAVPSLARLEPTLHSLEYQAKLNDAVGPLVREAGGRDALLRCGTPYTGPFLVPVLAWHLRLHTSQVNLNPRAPAVVFRERTTSGSRPVPTVRGIEGVPQENLATRDPMWRVIGACEAGAA
ncbi:MAG: hypothetical protein HZB46_06670 [Solirubrobacterales bacterium]|nr:hypothetical protein [Solirubrobacterales bacterium]